MPDDDDPVAAGSAEIFALFNEIGIIDQLASTEFARVLPHGLTTAQFSVLNHFVRLGDDKTPAYLAAAFQLTRGTMTSTLGRLQEKGFVQICPDPKDGRSKRVTITEAGRAAREDSIAAIAPELERTRQILTADERATLLPLLRKLRVWLDENRS